MSEKVDQLNVDAAAARAKGMSYGKYMLMKQAQQPVIIPEPKRFAGEGEAKCRQCGKIFVRDKHYRVYCSRLCRSIYQANHERNEKLRGGLGI